MKSEIPREQIPLPLPRTAGEVSRLRWEGFFKRVEEMKRKPRKRK